MEPLKILVTIGVVLVILAACQGSSEPLQANAGTDFTIKVGEKPTFDGCASTGNIENYKWMIVSAPDQMAQDSGKVICEVEPNCSFTLGTAMKPEEAGEWVLRLEVKDTQGNTSADEVAVSVEP